MPYDGLCMPVVPHLKGGGSQNRIIKNTSFIPQRPTSWAAGGAFAADCGSAWSNFCWLGASFGGSSWALGGSWVSLGFKRSLPKDISPIVPLRYLGPKISQSVGKCGPTSLGTKHGCGFGPPPRVASLRLSQRRRAAWCLQNKAVG